MVLVPLLFIVEEERDWARMVRALIIPWRITSPAILVVARKKKKKSEKTIKLSTWETDLDLTKDLFCFPGHSMYSLFRFSFFCCLQPPFSLDLLFARVLLM